MFDKEITDVVSITNRYLNCNLIRDCYRIGHNRLWWFHRHSFVW